MIEHIRGGHISKTSYPEAKVADAAKEIDSDFASGARPDMKLLLRYTPAAIAHKINKKGQQLPAQPFFDAVTHMLVEQERADLAQRQLGLLVLRRLCG